MDPATDERLARDRRSRWAAAILGGFAGFTLCLIGAYFYVHRGVTVAVHNADATTLFDCVVITTGYSYPVGDIRPGQLIRIRVRTKGESHVEIEFRDAEGRRRKLSADCYFERGDSGMVAITVDREKVISTIDNLHLR